MLPLARVLPKARLFVLLVLLLAVFWSILGRYEASEAHALQSTLRTVGPYQGWTQGLCLVVVLWSY